MEFTTLGMAGPKVSRIGVGGCPLGGHGWGPVDQDKLVRSIHPAVDRGVNFFDTADVYGLGESESFLGRELKDKRKRIVLASKFGVRISDGRTTYDNSRTWLEQAIDSSLKRLGTEYLDLYQVHYWDGKTPWSEIIAGLERLREKGKIRFAGLSNVAPSDLAGITLPPWVVSIQLQYSLVDRYHEPIINTWEREYGLSLMSWGSLGQGVLTGKFAGGASFAADDRRSRPIYENFHGQKFSEINALLGKLRGLSAARAKTLAQIALRWILDSRPRSVALVGVKEPAQLEENSLATQWNLETAELEFLNAAAEVFRQRTFRNELHAA